MSTTEEVQAAERKMNEAKEALQRHMDRPAEDPSDNALGRRLADELKQATHEYVTTVAALRS